MLTYTYTHINTTTRRELVRQIGEAEARGRKTSTGISCRKSAVTGQGGGGGSSLTKRSASGSQNKGLSKRGTFSAAGVGLGGVGVVGGSSQRGVGVGGRPDEGVDGVAQSVGDGGVVPTEDSRDTESDSLAGEEEKKEGEEEEAQVHGSGGKGRGSGADIQDMEVCDDDVKEGGDDVHVARDIGSDVSGADGEEEGEGKGGKEHDSVEDGEEEIEEERMEEGLSGQARKGNSKETHAHTDKSEWLPSNCHPCPYGADCYR